MKKNAVLVCQAPVEVPNILYFYEEIKDKYAHISFVSRDTNSFNDFFKLLGLRGDYVHWENNYCFDSLRPWTWRNYQRQVLSNIAKLDMTDCDIYYSSRYDFFSYCHFMHLPASTLFFYRDKRDSEVWRYKGLGEMNIKQRIRKMVDLIVKSLYCRTKFKYDNCGSISILGFSPFRLGHNVMPNLTNRQEIEMYKKYRYHVKVEYEKQAVLFTEPYRNPFQTESDYISKNRLIVNELHKKGYAVIMKGHPRLGGCQEIEPDVDTIIPNYVPSEFIDFSMFDIAIGFVSTALCGVSDIMPVYSIINLCEVTNEKLANYWRQYLTDNSNGKVRFICNFDEI